MWSAHYTRRLISIDCQIFSATIRKYYVYLFAYYQVWNSFLGTLWVEVVKVWITRNNCVSQRDGVKKSVGNREYSAQMRSDLWPKMKRPSVECSSTKRMTDEQSFSCKRTPEHYFSFSGTIFQVLISGTIKLGLRIRLVTKNTEYVLEIPLGNSKTIWTTNPLLIERQNRVHRTGSYPFRTLFWNCQNYS